MVVKVFKNPHERNKLLSVKTSNLKVFVSGFFDGFFDNNKDFKLRWLA